MRLHSTKRAVLGLLFLILSFYSRAAWAAVYDVDPDHTTVTFKIKHLFSNVVGHFDKFDGMIDYDPAKPDTWKTSGTIQADSVNTNVKERDTHLKSKDFFDVTKFPTITFKSTGIEDASKDGATLKGLITIHGVEKPITLKVEIHGVGKDPWGNVRAGFTGTTRINRKDFGLTWNQALETGGFLVGDDVDITVEAEGILKP